MNKLNYAFDFLLLWIVKSSFKFGWFC